MCGGFTCSKNALIALNIFYIIVAFILIGVASYAKASSLLPSIPIVGGIIACGIFLLIISIIGLIGAVRHHQVLLFFYMVVLFLLFIIQFSVACACLAVNDDQRRQIVKESWKNLGNETKNSIQKEASCCGVMDDSFSTNHPDCYVACGVKPAEITNETCTISPETETGSGSLLDCGNCANTCDVELEELIEHSFRASGGIGLFFSFTEIVGFCLAYRYRNMIDPRTNVEALM